VFDTLLPSSYNLNTINKTNSTNSTNNLNNGGTNNLKENQIILMASISDTFGGITNLTIPVKVE
jgi:hypothetical protein